MARRSRTGTSPLVRTPASEPSKGYPSRQGTCSWQRRRAKLTKPWGRRLRSTTSYPVCERKRRRGTKAAHQHPGTQAHTYPVWPERNSRAITTPSRDQQATLPPADGCENPSENASELQKNREFFSIKPVKPIKIRCIRDEDTYIYAVAYHASSCFHRLSPGVDLSR